MDILLKGDNANLLWRQEHFSVSAACGACGVTENAPCAEPYRGKEGFPMLCQKQWGVQGACKRPSSRFRVQGEMK